MLQGSTPRASRSSGGLFVSNMLINIHPIIYLRDRELLDRPIGGFGYGLQNLPDIGIAFLRQSGKKLLHFRFHLILV
jgi:hypothetical protein